MLKYIRYILSTRRAAKKYQQHIDQLHKMSPEDVIGIALWYCKDWLEYKATFTLDDRVMLKITNRAPSAGALMTALQSVHDDIIDTEKSYISMLPYWCEAMPITASADNWLVDNDGYFVEMNHVVKQLHDQLEEIHQIVNDPQNEDCKYHYTKKPKAVYESITDLLKHFH